MRRLFLWIGPALVLLLTLVCAFVAWGVGTQAGTRWALQTAVRQMDGEVGDIEGSVWSGVRIGRLAVKTPVVVVQLQNLYLQVDWRALTQRRLHGQDLSVDKLDIDILEAAGQPESSTPFSVPILPVQVAFDRISLGELSMSLSGKPLLLSVQDLLASLAITDKKAQLVFQSLKVGDKVSQAAIEGEINVLKLADPWPLEVHLKTRAQALEPDSPLCLRRFVPDLPTMVQPAAAASAGDKSAAGAKADKKKDALTELSALSAACALDIDASVIGSLQQLDVVLKGDGQDVRFDVNATLLPLAAFPFQAADMALQLADGSSLQGRLDWKLALVDGVVRDRLVGSLKSDKLNLRQVVGSAIPSGVISTRIAFDAQLLNHRDLLAADIDLDIAEGSSWNKQALSGVLKAKVVNRSPVSSVASAASVTPDTLGTPAAPVSSTTPDQAQTGASEAPGGSGPTLGEPLWKGLQLAGLSMDLRLGKNHVRGDGALGATDSRLTLDVAATRLADFWPDLAGGVQLRGQVGGSLAKHSADLNVVYTPGNSKPGQVGQSAADLHAVLTGGWGREDGEAEGWRGNLTALTLKHAGMSVGTRSPVALAFTPGAVAPAWQWQVGPTSIEGLLPSRRGVVINHKLSRGGAGRWETQGAIDQLAISRALVQEVQKLFGLEGKEQVDRGRVKLKSDEANDAKSIVLAANWDLKFAGVLEGQAHIKRLSGDLIVPGEPDFPLGLQTLAVDLTAKRAGDAVSRVVADLTLTTAKMGRIAATATGMLHTTPGGGFAIHENDVKTVSLDADIEDLGWVSLLAGDANEVGGSVQARLKAQSRPDGTWSASGPVTGKNIRVVRVDDGVRLLNGVLSGRLDNDRFVLDSLSFPATLRVEPKEWRTQEWVSTNPDAKGGSLTLSGEWRLFESAGVVNIDLYRYPVLQRTDRYAMVSGKLKLEAPLPRVAISGAIKADAGWFDLDMLSTIPSLDGDVVVVRAGDEQKQVSVPMDVSMDLNVDLGPRFYITGYGVNSGLIGQMQILMSNGKLTANGALRTRGGAIEAYGQRLQLRRGTITFQGDITSPVLNIEALRTGVAVEAGVRVAGTAKRPRIDLVSYPDVADVEKLSWLLLGRGPDESGGDAALLFSVGTSFLSGGEPFYRKFGLDEVGIHSGELGSTGSILPVESVVRGLNSGASDIENQFAVASKKLSNGITLSIEQALSDTGTVGRASYQLSRRWSANISAGTVNGIALIYRIFSMD